jgi:tetratricopeptide (TPR) repeat protein
VPGTKRSRGKKPSRPRKAKEAQPAFFDLRAMERLVAAVSGSADFDEKPSDLDRAQDIIYDAWEAPNAKQRAALARKALALSPHCADAYVILAEIAPAGSAERLDLYRQGVAAGQAALGPETFDRDVGHFWGLLETRPYMRARCGLGVTLWDRGEFDEAVGHLRDLLRLNPGDNQGIRYLLATGYLDLDRHDELTTLLAEYPDDGAPDWAYSSALLAFRQTGDTERSRERLAEALKSNPHVPPFLMGRRRIPKAMPAYITVGGESEAASYARRGEAAWIRTPGALAWLARAHSGRTAIADRPARRP